MSIKQDALHNAQQLMFQAFQDHYAQNTQPEKILVLEDVTGYIVRQVSSLFPDAQIDLYLKDFRRASALREQLKIRKQITVFDDVIPTASSQYDAVLLTVPKGRYYARKLFAASRE